MWIMFSNNLFHCSSVTWNIEFPASFYIFYEDCSIDLMLTAALFSLIIACHTHVILLCNHVRKTISQSKFYNKVMHWKKLIY